MNSYHRPWGQCGQLPGNGKDKRVVQILWMAVDNLIVHSHPQDGTVPGARYRGFKIQEGEENVLGDFTVRFIRISLTCFEICLKGIRGGKSALK